MRSEPDDGLCLAGIARFFQVNGKAQADAGAHDGCGPALFRRWTGVRLPAAFRHLGSGPNDSVMARNDKLPANTSSSTELQDFLRRVATTPVRVGGADRGRLIFALDATASRQPTWDQACHLQAQMFDETAALGGLEIQLAYYRGFNDFQAGDWTMNSRQLTHQMSGVACLAGETQIEKVLRHAVDESRRRRVNAVVFVGDCMEEDVDRLGKAAGELGLLGVPVFLFQEGHDMLAEFAFAQIARLTGGAHCRFDAGSAKMLRELLSAVAVFAAGGRKALENFARECGGPVLQIANQMKRG